MRVRVPDAEASCETPLGRMARRVADVVAEEWLVDVDALFSRERNKRIWGARRELWWRLSKEGFSASEIARLFERDHTTILAGLNRVRLDIKRASKKGDR